MHMKSHPVGAVLYAKALAVLYSLILLNPPTSSSTSLPVLEHGPVVCRSGVSGEILGLKGVGGLCWTRGHIFR